MTWSILFVAITTVICQTCFIFLGASTTRSKDGAVHKDIQGQTIGRCINWTQYALNIFIYTLGSKEFRLAYLDFIKLPCDRRSRKGEEEESSHSHLPACFSPHVKRLAHSPSPNLTVSGNGKRMVAPPSIAVS